MSLKINGHQFSFFAVLPIDCLRTIQHLLDDACFWVARQVCQEWSHHYWPRRTPLEALHAAIRWHNPAVLHMLKEMQYALKLSCSDRILAQYGTLQIAEDFTFYDCSNYIYWCRYAAQYHNSQFLRELLDSDQRPAIRHFEEIMKGAAIGGNLDAMREFGPRGDLRCISRMLYMNAVDHGQIDVIKYLCDEKEYDIPQNAIKKLIKIGNSAAVIWAIQETDNYILSGPDIRAIIRYDRRELFPFIGNLRKFAFIICGSCGNTAYLDYDQPIGDVFLRSIVRAVYYSPVEKCCAVLDWFKQKYGFRYFDQLYCKAKHLFVVEWAKSAGLQWPRNILSNTSKWGCFRPENIIWFVNHGAVVSRSVIRHALEYENVDIIAAVSCRPNAWPAIYREMADSGQCSDVVFEWILQNAVSAPCKFYWKMAKMIDAPRLAGMIRRNILSWPEFAVIARSASRNYLRILALVAADMLGRSIVNNRIEQLLENMLNCRGK